MIVLYKRNRQLIIHGIGANTKVSSNWVMLNEKCVNMMKYKSIGGKFVLGVKEICSREVKIYKYSRKKYARKKREKSRLHENEYTAKVPSRTSAIARSISVTSLPRRTVCYFRNKNRSNINASISLTIKCERCSLSKITRALSYNMRNSSAQSPTRKI